MQPWQPMAPLTPTPPRGGPSRGRRPGSVTAGAMLLVLAVVLDLAEVGVVTFAVIKQAAESKSQYGNNSSDLKFLTVSFIILIAANVVIAFGLTGGALAALRGRTAGLVLAWVFGIPAIALRCGCGGLGGYGLYDASKGGVNPFPNWLFGADIAIDSIALIVTLIAMILLMLGGSRRWLRGAPAAA